MKIHYINILLFALPLNILVHNQRNHNSTRYHTPKIPTNRSLCECEIYAPANYDNDPQMKMVMQQFQDRTSQRFHEYDDRMVEKRKQCKERCDKEIQKIILKDKLEKELMDKFATLDTDIQSDAIPTCVREKSIADNVEKDCLRCGYGLGTVAPTVGLFGSVVIGAWKNTALDAAIKAAIAKGAAAGIKAGDVVGMKVVIKFLEALKADKLCPDVFRSFQTTSHYTKVTGLVDIIDKQLDVTCSTSSSGNEAICGLRKTLGVEAMPGRELVKQKDAIAKVLDGALEKATDSAKTAADIATEEVTAAAIETNTGVVQTASYNWYATIGYSVLAIIIIVLIMVIIYLILRYRRKKKMKKKLQYMKLLNQ
ncbi:rifin [Plasmodium reichenowi]|uniref:Rifin n=1 Tax=Plasmodium reichenowi TaxID=5854 RepID=A0A060RM70_PLARE|nr:rifin [Plasmodium reichenowi]